jgi:carbonic anhydrase
MFEIIYRYDPEHPPSRRPPQDADEACRRLEEGNRLFSATVVGAMTGSRIVPIDLVDIGLAADSDVLTQHPFAAVLGCSDARAPTELIFDRACNELFVVRVAGNILGEAPLGSIGYAVDHLGESLKLIVVLGHSRCGAVSAAVDAYVTPVKYLGLFATHHVRGIVDTLLLAVRAAARNLDGVWGDSVKTRPGYRAALIECAVVFNAAMTAAILQQSFGPATHDRRVVYGVYDLGSRRVHVPLSAGEGGEPVVGLHTPPVTDDEFRQFASDVVKSAHVTAILGH